MLHGQALKMEVPGIFQQLLPPSRGTQSEEEPLHPQNYYCIHVGPGPRQLGGRLMVLVHVC